MLMLAADTASNTTAETALAISIASAAVALGGLVWQLSLFHLSGSRLEVRLIAAVLMADGPILEAQRGWKNEDPFDGAHGQWDVDLAHVRVINVGRTPVSVSQIGLDFGAPKWWRRRHRHRITGHPVKLEGATMEHVTRLDAGDSVSMYFDVWPMIESVRERRPGALVVRATAEPAGRRPRRSSWRQRWRIAADQTTLRPWQLVTPELAAFRTLWRLTRHREDAFSISGTWYVARPHLGDEIGLREVLEGIHGSGQIYIAHRVHESFMSDVAEASATSKEAPH